ncbi:MAG: hypothetical protein ACK2T7_05630 [Anaerolineales bacterium]
MKKTLFSTLLILTVLLMLSACAPDLPLPDGNDPAPVEDPLPPAEVVDPAVDPAVDPVEEPVDEPLPPLAAIKARELLATQLGLSVSQVEILETIQMDWSDSCLGLGGPAESCLAAITPGWQVNLLADGETHIARTDALGDSIRFEGMEVSFPVAPPISGVDEGSVPEAAILAQEKLAERLGITVSQVEIVSYEHTNWPDGCLGLAEPGLMCTMAIVPGWRVELSADGQSFIARTNETGSYIKFE